MIVKLKAPTIALLIPMALVLLLIGPALGAKPPKPLIATIKISAPPEAVFKAIQKMRDSQEMHRKLMSYDGKVAKIKENLEGVPIYGKVECVWEETEIPFDRIDYKMLSSDKFKSGSGSWILTPSSDHKSTDLELQSFLDTNLHIPFAGEITKMGASKDNKVRLQHIKDMAEESVTKGEAKQSSGAVPKK